MNPMHSSRTPVSRLRTSVRLGAVAVGACFLGAPAWANPSNPAVVNGSASFSQTGNVLTVTNSNGAIINWDKFSIQAGETTRFIQPSASSAVLNRVLNDPTAIYGTLSSNGRVWLVNPAGIFVGPGGRVDVAGFVASTLNISNQDFLAGRRLFTNEGNAQNVVNQGEITTPAGGSVYLIGSTASNEGIITTPKGETILAAGATVSLIDSATPGVKVELTGAQGNATNLGQIVAEAGRIGIAGVIVRNSGTLNASSVVSEGGRIFLQASQDAYVDGDGRIVTTGTKGGSVEVLGNRVAVMDNAQIDASGADGGGRILVGGDYQGQNPAVQNAQSTYFGPNARLNADATGVGDGGTVIVWADQGTQAYGTITARGGSVSGNGGLVETSGHQVLDANGARVDASATHGTGGTWLLDPGDATVDHATSGATLYGGLFAPSGASGTVNDFSINATLYGGTDVVISTAYGSGAALGGTITVNPGVLIENTGGGPRSLTLYADNNIAMTGTIIVGTAGNPLAINLNAGQSVATGSVTITRSRLDTWGAAMTVFGNNITLNSDTVGKGALLSTAGCATATGSNCSSTNRMSFVSGGMQTITASGGTLTLTALAAPAGTDVNGGVGIVSAGGQSVTASSINLTGAAGQRNGAHINNYYGGQTVNAHQIALIAGGTNATDYSDLADIYNFGPGGQTINITGGSGGSITLTAGGGGGSIAAADGGLGLPDVRSDGSCASAVGPSLCYFSRNSAVIANESTGPLAINFASPGGSIALTGGSSGAVNRAGIRSTSWDDMTVPGTLTIGDPTNRPDIVLNGGTSGGKVVEAFGQFNDMRNSASIEGDNTITVYAGNLTMNGNGGGGAVTGALIGGGSLNGGGTVTVNASGNVALTGGASAVVTALYGGNPYAFTSPAGIGNDKNVNVNVIAGGNVTLTGGSGTGGSVLVGSLTDSPGPTTVNLFAGNNITATGNTGGVDLGVKTRTGAFGDSLTIKSGWNAATNMPSGYGGDITTSGPVGLQTDDTTGNIVVYAYESSAGARGSVSLGAGTSGYGTYIDVEAAGNTDIAGSLTAVGDLYLAAGWNNYGGGPSLRGGNLTTAAASQLFGGTGGVGMDAYAGTSGTLGYGGGILTHNGMLVSDWYVDMYADRGININGSVTVYGGSSLYVYAGYDWTNRFGGDVVFGSASWVMVDDTINVYAYSGAESRGAIVQNAGSSITAYNTIGLYGDGDVRLNGLVSTPADVHFYAGIDNTSEGGPYTQSTYGGNIVLGATSQIYGGSVELIANRGSSDDSTGNISQAAGGYLDPFIGLDVKAAGNVALLGATVVAPGAIANVDAGYDYPGDGGSQAFADKRITINSLSAYGGAANLFATGPILAYTHDVDSILANVDNSSSGGIAIVNDGMSQPTWVNLSDNAMANSSTSFSHSGSDLLLTSNYTFSTTTYGGMGSILIAAPSNNLTYSSGYSGFFGSSLILAAGNMLNINGYLDFPGDLGLAAGNTLNVNAGVFANGNASLAAPTVNINSSGYVYSYQDVGVFGGVINLASGAWVEGENVFLGGGTLNLYGDVYAYGQVEFRLARVNGMYGGGLFAGNTDSNITGIVSGDILLDYGAYFQAGNDVNLTLTGATSTISLSNGACVHANSPDTITLVFAGRSSGGVLIDGVQTTTTLPGGSGFFVDYDTPARPGAGLDIRYASSGVTDLCAINPTLCKSNPNASPIGGPPRPGKPGKDQKCEPGSFGCEETETTDGSKNDKSPKSVAQCGI